MLFMLADLAGNRQHVFDVPLISAAVIEEGDPNEDLQHEVVAQLEADYGVLDWDEGEDSFGCFSYQLEEHDCPVMLDAFRQFFARRGYQVGEPSLRLLDPRGRSSSSAVSTMAPLSGSARSLTSECAPKPALRAAAPLVEARAV